jgi:lactoylglutathione lyase
MGSQVCVIGIYVPDLNKAVDFYSNTLGFQLNKHYGSKIVTLMHEEIPIVLEESEGAAYNRDNNVSGVVLALRTEDIEETLKLLKEKEVELVVDTPADCPPGRYISFRDPFGNVLEYIQFDTLE